jgi:ribonuclease P protein component
MLPKELRLPSKEIPSIVRSGSASHNELFEVKALPSAGKELPKFAISISIKILRNSTARNKARRRIREAIISLVKAGAITQGKYLIIVKSEKVTDSEVEVRTALAALLRS